MSGRTVWPCSHLGHVPFKWCRVVPFCLFAGWLFGINPNPVCVSLGGVSHPTVSQCEQSEAQEAGLLHGLPAAGRGGGAPGPRAPPVRLQEMPRSVLQVPQRPQDVYSEGECVSHGPRQVERKVRCISVLLVVTGSYELLRSVWSL